MTSASMSYEDDARRDADLTSCLLIVGGYADVAKSLGPVMKAATRRIVMSPTLGDFIAVRSVDFGPRPKRDADRAEAVARIVGAIEHPEGEMARNFFAVVVIDPSARAIESVLADCQADPFIARLPLRCRGYAWDDDRRAQKGSQSGRTPPDGTVVSVSEWSEDDLVTELRRYADDLLRDFAAGTNKSISRAQIDAIRAQTWPGRAMPAPPAADPRPEARRGTSVHAPTRTAARPPAEPAPPTLPRRPDHSGSPLRREEPNLPVREPRPVASSQAVTSPAAAPTATAPLATAQPATAPPATTNPSPGPQDQDAPTAQLRRPPDLRAYPAPSAHPSPSAPPGSRGPSPVPAQARGQAADSRDRSLAPPKSPAQAPDLMAGEPGTPPSTPAAIAPSPAAEALRTAIIVIAKALLKVMLSVIRLIAKLARRVFRLPEPIGELPADTNSALFLFLAGDGAIDRNAWLHGRKVLLQLDHKAAQVDGLSYGVWAEHSIQRAPNVTLRPAGMLTGRDFKTVVDRFDYLHALRVMRTIVARELGTLGAAELKIRSALVIYALSAPSDNPDLLKIYRDITELVSVIWIMRERTAKRFPVEFREGGSRIVTDHPAVADEVLSMLVNLR
jgi:hypothetical protein